MKFLIVPKSSDAVANPVFSPTCATRLLLPHHPRPECHHRGRQATIEALEPQAKIAETSVVTSVQGYSSELPAGLIRHRRLCPGNGRYPKAAGTCCHNQVPLVGLVPLLGPCATNEACAPPPSLSVAQPPLPVASMLVFKCEAPCEYRFGEVPCRSCGAFGRHEKAPLLSRAFALSVVRCPDRCTP